TLSTAGGDDVFVSMFLANAPPVASNSSVTTDEDTAASSNLVASDPDGNPLTYTIVSNPTHGTISGLNASTGAFTYTPNSNYNGADSFTFKVNDGEFDSNVATVSITVNPVNDAPVADDQAFTTDEDTLLQAQLVATDVDGDSLTFTRLTNASHGAVSVQSNGQFRYIPFANYNGPDSFTFQVSDGTLTDTATVNSAGTPVKDPPFFDNPTKFTSPEDQTLRASIPSLDVEGDAVTFSLVAGSGLGSSILLNPDGSFEYTPIADYNGFDA